MVKSLYLEKKKAKPDPEELEAIESKLLLQRKVNPRALDKYKQKLLAEFAPFVLPEMLQAVRKGVKRGDMRAVQHARELYGLASSKGPIVSIENNNTAQAAHVESESRSGRPRSVEGIIRNLPEENLSLKAIECQPLSLQPETILSPIPAGSEILA